jgi:hypothetical protein
MRQAIAHLAIIIIVTVNAHLGVYQAELVRNLIAIGKPVIGIAAYRLNKKEWVFLCRTMSKLS